MQGIGPGSILGGRYSADRRTAQYAGAERWTARDTTLDRTVVLFTVPRSHPNVDAVLDAARRSAGLDNPRLSRILDVGADDDIAYVVEESLEGSHSLAALLGAGALPAPEVRRIAGETALVLDLARHRGLHHQRLTPDLVMRTADGDVKVRGLATMAALAGVDDVDDQTAARTDAMAVVAIAYAGFTGHWPLPGGGGGLPSAPRVASHVAAPSEIAVGVPADLDALCRLTFANNQGPLTPGDFARQIAPWSPIPVLLPTLDPPEQSDLSHPGGPSRRPFATDGRSDAEDTAARPHRAGDDDRDAGDTAAGPPDDADAGSDAGAPETAGDRASRSEPLRPLAISPDGGVVPVARRVPERPGPTPGAGTARPGGGQPPRPPGRPATAPAGAAGAVPRTPTPTKPVPGPAEPAGPSPLAAMTAATSAALGSASAATASAAKALSGRLTEWSDTTRERARGAVDDVRARREAGSAARAARTGPGTRPPTQGERAASGPDPMGSVAGAPRRDRDALESPVPLLPASAAEPLTREQSRLALGIIVGFLVLALVLAMWGLSRIPSLPTLTSDTSEPAATGTATAGATDSATDTDGDGTADAPAAPAPLTFTAVQDYDPLGDGAERPEDLPLILDGDDATAWGSEGYRSASFSGLKPGLGVVLDLGEPSPISTLTLVLPSETTGRVFVTDDEGYAGEGKPLAEDLAEAGTFEGSGTVTVDLAEGASGRFVIVWFTEISTGGEQWFRARLAGASATS